MRNITSSFGLVYRTFDLYKKIHRQQNNEIVRLVQTDLFNELKKVVPELPVDKQLYSMAHTIFVLISQGVIEFGLTHKQMDDLKKLLATDVIYNGQKGGSREEYEMTRSKWNTWGKSVTNILLIVLLILNTLQAFNIVNDFRNDIKSYEIPMKVHTLKDIDLIKETNEIVPVGYTFQSETNIRQEPLDIQYAQGFGDIYNLMLSRNVEQTSLYNSIYLFTQPKITKLYKDATDRLKLYSEERIQVVKHKIERDIESEVSDKEIGILSFVKAVIDNFYDAGTKKDAFYRKKDLFIKRLMEDETKELGRLFSDYLTEQGRVAEDVLMKLKTDISSFTTKLWTVVIIELIIPLLMLWINGIISTRVCLRILKGLKIGLGRIHPSLDMALEWMISYIEERSYVVKERSDGSRSDGSRSDGSRTLKMIKYKGGRKKRTLKRRSKK